MKVLELDAGNTRLKWRLREHNTIHTHGSLANSQCWDEHLPRIIDGLGQFDKALISAVSGSERYELLSSLLMKGFGIKLRKAETQTQHLGMTIAYKQGQAFGVDRWLAMLAVHNKHPEDHKIIIDSGTALTIDIVDNKGVHEGGYIVPGMELMKQSLQLNTANLTVCENNAESIEPGKTTQQCINHGVLAMSAAMINSQIIKLPDSVIYLTGGGSSILRPYIEAECHYQPDLVMDGLSLAFKDEQCAG